MEITSKSYKEAGVDVSAGYKAVELMKKHVERTNTPGVMEGIGGFGGLFAPSLEGISEPVLVSGTDGVGTKLRIAFVMDKHDTIGIDCVAMCTNDIVCAGATPLFFLDYLALGKNVPERVEQIVKGVADGCVSSGCALVGGETAEMPGFYKEDEYDLAGFAVGLVDKSKILDKENAAEGDVILGLASSGVHSNGFSLVRKVLGDDKESLHTYREELGMTVGDCLLTPTRIYVKPILALLEQVDVKVVAHITGGGFYENIPRSLPDHLGADIKEGSFEIPAIFDVIQKEGDISTTDMFATFNMGIGMCVILPKEQAEKAKEILTQQGETVYEIGTVTREHTGVKFV